jgi:hypothetical protein
MYIDEKNMKETVRRLPDRPNLRRKTGFIRHSKRLPNQRPVYRNRQDNNRHPNQRNHNDPPRRFTQGQGFYPEIINPFHNLFHPEKNTDY